MQLSQRERDGSRSRRIAWSLLVMTFIAQCGATSERSDRVDRSRSTADPDRAGLIAQAQQPTSPPSHTRPVVIDRQSQEVFLRALLAIARHRDWADAAFVERTLSARLKIDPELSRDGGRYYDVMSARPIFSVMGMGYLIDNAGYEGSHRVLLATRVDQERLCIRPEVVASVFGEGRPNRELERRFEGRVRRVAYDFSMGETRRGFVVTFERRREFCVDLFNFIQNQRELYR